MNLSDFLKQIEELDVKATKGLWTYETQWGTRGDLTPWAYYAVLDENCNEIGTLDKEEDAAFVCAAHNALPKAAKVIRALKEANEGNFGWPALEEYINSILEE